MLSHCRLMHVMVLSTEHSSSSAPRSIYVCFLLLQEKIGIRCLRNHITSFYFPHYENSYNLNCKLCSLARMTLFTIQTWIKITGVSYYITYLNKGMFIHEVLGENVNMALCDGGRFCQVLKSEGCFRDCCFYCSWLQSKRWWQGYPGL